MTISQLLKKYFKKVSKPELIDSKEKIIFLYNAVKIKYDDTTKVEKFFNMVANPKVMIIDSFNLI